MFSEALPGRSPGAAVLVSQGGTRLFERAYGYASLELGVKLTPQAKFRIGSITKQFTAAAILRLSEQGRLSVDDPLSKHLPAIRRATR
jgi:CubicO group peptidase (beta-lactamase class C family)